MGEYKINPHHNDYPNGTWIKDPLGDNWSEGPYTVKPKPMPYPSHEQLSEYYTRQMEIEEAKAAKRAKELKQLEELLAKKKAKEAAEAAKKAAAKKKRKPRKKPAPPVHSDEIYERQV